MAWEGNRHPNLGITESPKKDEPKRGPHQDTS